MTNSIRKSRTVDYYSSTSESLWNEKDGKLYEPSLMKTGVPFAFVVAVGGVGFDDVAVAGFQFFDDSGFIDRSGSDIISQCAEKD